MANPRSENFAKKSDVTTFDNYQKNLKHLLSGAISGFISRTCTAPLERVVILQQTRNPTYLGLPIPKILVNMVKREGILSCWKGNGANLLRIIPFTSIELFSYEFYKYQFDKLFDSNQIQGNRNVLYLLAGAAAGMTAATVVYPLDLVRTLFAFQTNTSRSASIIGTWTDIVRRQGFFALYRGLGATCMGISPYSSLKLATFQLLQNQFRGRNKGKPSSLVNFTFGAISACVAITITYPTDLIRKRFQVKVLQKEIENMTYLSYAREIVAKEGFRGLYYGLTASYLRLIPIVGIALSVNEKLKDKWNI